jgi:phage shock protein A
MSILNRLNRIIRSNISDLRTSGASGSIDRVLGEMETSLKDARRQRVKLRAQEKKIVAAIRQARDKADQWEDRAMMALRRDEEDLARDALVVRNEALDEAAGLRDELDELRMYLQDIESALEALEMKLEGTRGRIQATEPTRAPRRVRGESDWDAEFRRRVQQRDGDTDGEARTTRPRSSAGRDFGDERLFDEMDRMSSKVDAYEAEVEAMRELSDDNLRDPGRSRLEERFRNLEGKEDLDRLKRRQKDGERDDLADLKKKFED